MEALVVSEILTSASFRQEPKRSYRRVLFQREPSGTGMTPGEGLRPLLLRKYALRRESDAGAGVLYGITYETGLPAPK